MADLTFSQWRPHPWHGLSAGDDAPRVVNAYIEITPFDLIKYEVDKASGYLRVDRPQRTSSQPPALYGFIPRTYCGPRVAALTPVTKRGDGDPLDICVLSERPIAKSEILLSARVIGGLQLVDRDEADDKIIAVLQGGTSSGPLRLLQGGALVVIGIAVVGGVMMSFGLKLAGWSEPESEAEFERLVVESERLARDGVAAEPDEVEFMDLDPFDDDDFAELVRDAMDELPDILQRALERNVAVVISNGGRKAGAYGLYHGDGVARDDVADRIVIYRDTLRRDFGHDPELLREQVTITVRHELAHHLGADELGVRDLGL